MNVFSVMIETKLKCIYDIYEDIYLDYFKLYMYCSSTNTFYSRMGHVDHKKAKMYLNHLIMEKIIQNFI